MGYALSDTDLLVPIADLYEKSKAKRDKHKQIPTLVCTLYF